MWSVAVLPLCYYGKVLDFMMKNTRLQIGQITKKIGIVLKKRRVFDEHYIMYLFTCPGPDGP